MHATTTEPTDLSAKLVELQRHPASAAPDVAHDGAPMLVLNAGGAP